MSSLTGNLFDPIGSAMNRSDVAPNTRLEGIVNRVVVRPFAVPIRIR
jgi:hypothetical protein